MESLDRLTYLPLKIILGFLIFTQILFFIGPIDYKIQSYFILVLYLLSANLALFLGYRFGVKRSKSVKCRRFGSITFLHFIIIFSVILIIPDFVISLDLDSFSLSKIGKLVSNSIENPLVGQQLAQSRNYKGILSKIFLIASPIYFASIPLGIRYWFKLSHLFKFFIILIILTSVLISISLSQRGRILNILLITFFLSLANNASFLKERAKFLIFLVIFSVIAFLFYFTYVNLDRHGIKSISSISSTLFSYYYSNVKFCYINNTSPFFWIPLVEIEYYLSQGYYSLGLAFDVSSYSDVFTYGLGNNLFTATISHEYFQYDVLNSSYMGLLERYFNIDPLSNWHTIYLWLANDFTFLGSLVIVFYIGFLFAQSWIFNLNGNNFSSVVLFSFMLISVFFFFANNQVLSFNFIPFLVTYLLYMFTK